MGNLAALAATEGAYERALEAAAQTQALAQAIGERFVLANAHMLTGHGLAGLGRWDTAAAAYRQSCDSFHGVARSDATVEPLAGLARIALGQGDVAGALTQVEPILAQLESGEAEPQEETLRAANDSRAHAVLERAHDRLQEQAVKITDDAMRQSFLENVPCHREIVAAWAEAIGDDH